MKRQHILHKEEVEPLLHRFMDGTSTLEEEAQLADFFRSHKVAGEWKEYQEMFALFDAGEVEVKAVKKPTSRWKYVGIAAAVALLLSLGFFFFYRSHPTEKSDLIVKTDTIKTAPQTEQQQVEEPPQRKEAQDEKADTVNKAKEIQRIVRPPKTYMAQATPSKPKEKNPQPVPEEVESEPTIIDSTKPIDGKVAIEYAGYTIRLYNEFEIPSKFENVEREIQERGERLTHSIELAMSGEDY